MFNPAYGGVVMIGLLHGLEPGHGWPLALVYASKKRDPLISGFISSGIIAFAHFVSSIAVVVVYILLRSWLDFNASFIKYLAMALLLILAYRLYREKVDDLEKQHGHLHHDQPTVEHEHEHEHPGQGLHIHRHKHATGIALSLWGLASFAFILGFVHEEEFALLALVAGGVNAFTLMILYGLSVAVALMGATLIGIKVFKHLQSKLARYERYLPKIGAATLVAMAIIIVFW
jgi:ABC-type nickel/cobalt efflux system permease component RcnA